MAKLDVTVQVVRDKTSMNDQLCMPLLMQHGDCVLYRKGSF